MNISHNYSRLGEEENSNGLYSDSLHNNDLLPRCMDENQLRELINIPSAMFFSSPDSSE